MAGETKGGLDGADATGAGGLVVLQDGVEGIYGAIGDLLQASEDSAEGLAAGAAEMGLKGVLFEPAEDAALPDGGEFGSPGDGLAAEQGGDGPLLFDG